MAKPARSASGRFKKRRGGRRRRRRLSGMQRLTRDVKRTVNRFTRPFGVRL